MIFALLVCTGSLAPPPPEQPASARDLTAYETASARVGRSPAAHLKLALWCEAHGLKAERLKHLALAALIDPRNGAARGLLGMVSYRGHWLRPDAVSDKVGADADLAGRQAGRVQRASGQARRLGRRPLE